VERIDFACLANCFYFQCSTSASSFHSVFRILEAIDYFFTKELNDAVSLSEATAIFMKNFVCTFGIFGALQSCTFGDTAIKSMCLIPFLSIIFKRTNIKSKELSEYGQKQLYLAFNHAMESFEIVESMTIFVLESNELLLMTEYRKALHCVDINLMDTDYSTHTTKKYDDFITRLTTKIAGSDGDHPAAKPVDLTFLATTRNFLARQFDGPVC
jgi:hypothetical protein